MATSPIFLTTWVLLTSCNTLAWRVLPRLGVAHARHSCSRCPDLDRVAAAVRSESQASLREANVAVREAGSKGMGVFAKEQLKKGMWVGMYHGTLTTDEETMHRYNCTNIMSASLSCDYLAQLDDVLSIDAQNSTHFSRYFNHAEHGNLDTAVDKEKLQINFFAARDIEVGEELTFDYGVRYWLYRPQPESDSRNFSDPYYRESPPELSLQYPPPVGTVLPLTPLTAREMQAALALPEEESVAALLRCLEYFGAKRTKDGALEVSFGVRPDAERQVLRGDQLTHSTLQRAATACVVQAVLDPADPSGAASQAFENWLNFANRELAFVRSWRAHVPRLASVDHDVVALAVHLLCKDSARRNSLVEELQNESGEDTVDKVLGELSQHVPEQRISKTVSRLKQWFELGHGCMVASNRPPRLEGTVPRHYSIVWNRVPRLVELGLLKYD